MARRAIYKLTEPVLQFALLSVALLLVLWAATLNLVRVETEGAEEIARISTLDLAETYEAQMVRALRDIEQTLNLVAYVSGQGDPETILSELSARGLLPPSALFIITVFAADGSGLVSTRPLGTVPALDMSVLQSTSDAEALLVSQPRFDADNQQWWLDFSIALFAPDGTVNGAVTVSADAEYFVSGYDADQLGEHGLLAVIGNDGNFRVRRSGDDTSFSGTDTILRELAGAASDMPTVSILLHEYDGVERYTHSREVFGFPLRLAVGLSLAEQHAGLAAIIRSYLWRTVAVSLLILLVTGTLGRMSSQLHHTRARVLEEQLEHARQVEYLAFHDSLTGLPNRSFFAKLLHQRIVDSRRSMKKFAVMFLDIDKFKIINDTLGHDAGDQLLKEVAHRIRAALRESDVVARMGGDEFTIILPETGEDEQLIEASRRILSLVRNSYLLAGQELRITVSIGISVYPRDGEDEDSLMKRADIAMYYAKGEGRNNFKFYTDEINTDSLERLTLEASLRNAVERNQLELFYQAKRDLSNDCITGMEALLRWHHPDLGLILPKQFIPIAEETRLIIPIGRWVLETACRQSVEWRNKGIDLSMAVNLSAVQFRDDNLLRDIEEVLAKVGMDPRMLELEITESMIMSDLTKTIGVMQGIKRLGVRIAIDDFGTGYSSLSALKDFPIDTIKIDGSFISDIVANKDSQGLAAAIIAMGRTLGLNVIAEGVESKDQMDYLKSGVCDEFQGFYLNKPMPSAEFERMLRKDSAT
ncbi:MAG: EAL domain-containing protein [Gammaproteobacteria bacterium]|nr:EAL domain-containing protein [Gammaproteobacteria bacterium]